MKKKCLNLGCGTEIKSSNIDEEWINVDIVRLEGVDIGLDLNKIPYPMFLKEEFDLIILDDVLEHLDEPPKIIGECHRLLKKGGQLKIKVLYWNHKYNYSDPQHKHVFTEIYFEFFCGRRVYYGYPQFSKLEVKYGFDSRAKQTFGEDYDTLMERAYFYNNIIDAIEVVLTK